MKFSLLELSVLSQTVCVGWAFVKGLRSVKILLRQTAKAPLVGWVPYFPGNPVFLSMFLDAAWAYPERKIPVCVDWECRSTSRVKLSSFDKKNSEDDANQDDAAPCSCFCYCWCWRWWWWWYLDVLGPSVLRHGIRERRRPYVPHSARR